ncbi:MAG: hypothetical protein ABSA59_12840, partial [Terriglobia bacterium]
PPRRLEGSAFQAVRRGRKWASWAGKAEPFRTAARQSRIEYDGFPLIGTAVVSDRRSALGERRYNLCRSV